MSMISVASALTMTAVAGSDGSNGIIAALAGTASGLFIGLLVRVFQWHRGGAWLRVNPFVTTLARHIVEYLLGHRHPRFPTDTRFSEYRGTQLAGYRLARTGNTDVRSSMPVAVGIASDLLLQRTIVGRTSDVLGSNPAAAIVAGWPRRRLLALAYVLSASLTAVGALSSPHAPLQARQTWAAGSLPRRSRLPVYRRRQSNGRTWWPRFSANRLVLHYYSLSNGMNLSEMAWPRRRWSWARSSSCRRARPGSPEWTSRSRELGAGMHLRSKSRGRSRRKREANGLCLGGAHLTLRSQLQIRIKVGTPAR